MNSMRSVSPDATTGGLILAAVSMFLGHAQHYPVLAGKHGDPSYRGGTASVDQLLD